MTGQLWQGADMPGIPTGLYRCRASKVVPSCHALGGGARHAPPENLEFAWPLFEMVHSTAARRGSCLLPRTTSGWGLLSYQGFYWSNYWDWIVYM